MNQCLEQGKTAQISGVESGFLSGKGGEASTPTVIFQYSINFYLLQCYYVGGTEDAATYILNEITKPLGYFMSPEAICEKLKKKDRQICELQYGKFKMMFIKLC